MKGRINIENYEEFVIDFIDGTLDDGLMAEMRAFLILFPNIEEEIDAMREMEALEAPTTASFDRALIKKEVVSTSSITADNYEEVFAQHADGTLSTQERTELDAFLDGNAFLQNDFNLYQKSVLKPNAEIQFPGKSSLKQAIPLWQNARVQAVRIAAVLTLGLGAYSVLQMINDEVYIPRTSSTTYALIDEVSPMTRTTTQRAAETKAARPSEPVFAAQVVSFEREPSSIERIQMRKASLESSSKTSVADRSMLAYEPSISEWIPNASNAQELNVTQYVGQEFLALNPDQAETPGSLLKETIKRAINNQETMELKEQENKQTFQFLANNFEFKRVNYK